MECNSSFQVKKMGPINKIKKWYAYVYKIHYIHTHKLNTKIMGKWLQKIWLINGSIQKKMW